MNKMLWTTKFFQNGIIFTINADCATRFHARQPLENFYIPDSCSAFRFVLFENVDVKAVPWLFCFFTPVSCRGTFIGGFIKIFKLLNWNGADALYLNKFLFLLLWILIYIQISVSVTNSEPVLACLGQGNAKDRI